MRKIPCILLLLLFNYSYSQYVITELVISPTDYDDIVNVLVTTGHNHGHFYLDEDYEIANNIITLKICVFGNALTGVSYVTTNRDILLPNIPENYTLICEIYEGIYTLPCEYLPEDMADSASLSFSAPLDEAVFLNAPYFDRPEKEVTIFPNPTVKEFFIESPFSNLQNIIVYDLQGKQVKIFEPQEVDTPRFDVSELASGVYFIAMEVEGARVVKKLVVKK